MSIGTIYRRGNPPNVQFKFATTNDAGFAVIATSFTDKMSRIMAADETFLYGRNENLALQVRHKSNVTTAVINTSQPITIQSMAVDETYLYCTAQPNYIDKYYKNNLVLATSTNASVGFGTTSGNMRQTFVDDTYLYMTLHPAGTSISHIYRFYKENMTFDTNTANIPINPSHQSFEVTTDYIYAVGNSTLTKLHRSNLAIQTQVNIAGVNTRLNAVHVDDNFVFITDPKNVIKLFKSNLVEADRVDNIRGASNFNAPHYWKDSLRGDENFLYFNFHGVFPGGVVKVSKSSLTYVSGRYIDTGSSLNHNPNYFYIDDQFLYWVFGANSSAAPQLQKARKFTTINDSVGELILNNKKYKKERYLK